MISLFSTYTVHHVGIVVPSLEQVESFMETMGLVEDYRGYVEPWSCWCIFAKGGTGAVIELVVADDGPLRRFNKGVGGVHHFALEVDDIRRVSNELTARGLTMLMPQPIKGAGSFLCNFINPLSTRGIQIELVQMI
jgi:methylmalonyl-CoA/ethylmalonyl-CoA epimerase